MVNIEIIESIVHMWIIVKLSIAISLTYLCDRCM